MKTRTDAKSKANTNPFWGGPHIMGVVNVTPDSFSDGGQFFSPEKAIKHGLEMTRQGVHLLDIGGESTRPGAQSVEIAEEIARVLPVIEGLSAALRNSEVRISIDTRNAKTMESALKAGAHIINDISALSYDPCSIDVAKEAQVPVFLMHTQGTPATMQENPSYSNVVEEIFQYLQQRIKLCETHRIDASLLACDPGLGFGKTTEHNMLILRNIKRFHDLGTPILLGASRKSFISKISGDEPADDRIPGSLSAALYGYSQGVQIFRVHDVKETVQAFKIYQAILSAHDETTFDE